MMENCPGVHDKQQNGRKTAADNMRNAIKTKAPPADETREEANQPIDEREFKCGERERGEAFDKCVEV